MRTLVRCSSAIAGVVMAAYGPEEALPSQLYFIIAKCLFCNQNTNLRSGQVGGDHGKHRRLVL